MIEFNVVFGRLDQKDVSVDLVGWFVVMGGENLSQKALGGDGELKRNKIKSKAHKKTSSKTHQVQRMSSVVQKFDDACKTSVERRKIFKFHCSLRNQVQE